ncbi:MAG TPA: ectoine/hydroxyectoine ABC transporter permease subunit EhuC [bacterium]|nr:ectoine/hydroxyectoine ABC transporter permease subunit EhuC [bacterium]
MLQFLPQLLQGAVVTVQITVLASLLAVAMAFAAGLARLSHLWPVRAVSAVYVEIFRGSSALVQLFWLFFVLPFFGITLSAFQVAVLGLGLNVGAYGSEVVRGAIVAVPKGQYESCTALNMTRWQMMRHIIVPQAVITMLPPWGNLFIELLKSTALVSLITLGDLTFKAYQLNQATFRTAEIFSLVLLIYFAIALVITGGMRLAERRLGRGLARGGLG